MTKKICFKINLTVVALASLMISACSTAPKTTTEQASLHEMATNNGQVSALTETGNATSIEAGSSGLARLQEMQKDSVYFDLNEFVIKPEYREVIKQQADLMKTRTNIIVTLEGNADERGSGEYNLSLGDKRANTVRKSLEMMGVPGNRIKAVSLGEERPRQTCHEEQCWKENRRVDFIGKLN